MFRSLFSTLFMVILTTGTAVASNFERPIPQPRSESVELWFACASLLFCIALYGVHRMVKRR